MDAFQGHDVVTVPEMGWAGTSDRELLQRAAGRFDVFVTVDPGVRSQPNLASFEIGVLVLAAASNRLSALLPLMPDALASLEHLRAGDIVRVGPPA